MITAVALMCAMNDLNICQAIHKADFFRTIEECEADIGNALMYIESQGMFMVDYRCVVWGESV